jgi:hypothetical protein
VAAATALAARVSVEAMGAGRGERRNDQCIQIQPQPDLHIPATTGTMASGSGCGATDALHAAASAGLVDVVQAMLATGRADPASDYDFALRCAAGRAHAAVVEALLADGRADPALYNSAVLRIAARHGHTAVVQALLADGRADPAAESSAALSQAADFGHFAVVAALLADGRADPATGEYFVLRKAVYVACGSGHTDFLRALLDDGRVDERRANIARANAGHLHLPYIQSADACLGQWRRWQRRRQWLRAAAC